ncbi:PAS domain-containing sensor histidine kinase [Microvirga flavescens]|uniref:PAS domain-containing sensor histidine kinase n=1 Tax=Microvirga flavescens TaxID=2249811 RepID=UPI001FDF8F77|nr:PAS domain-containing sensor histidine kinase [Microvirga flavescens]
MAGQAERQGKTFDPVAAAGGVRLRTALGAALMSTCASPALAAPITLPYMDKINALIGALPALDPQNAASFAFFMGLVAISATTSIMLIRERRASTRRTRKLRAELARLQGADDRATLLMGSDRQLLVSWAGPGGEPRFEGDPSLAGEGATTNRILAFGHWLAPADAAAVEHALDTLKERGESFRVTARTLFNTFVEAEGRTFGASAILRLRDVTGDRSALLSVQSDLASAKADLRAMTVLIDSIAHPLWIRDEAGRLIWANQAYLRAVEAESVEDATLRSLELMGERARDEALRQRASGKPFHERVKAVVGGRRSVLDVVEYPTGGGSAGIAVDVSELDSVRTDLQRQMDANVRTLDQLPTAVAIFDGSQQLVFSNEAYQRLWNLDPAFLASHPKDGEILDRLHSARKLPEQADFRAWKAEIQASYRTVESREVWWHLPDRRSLRVVINPNPQGGVTYLFDDVSERIELESQVNSLTSVQSETLNTLKEGVAVFGSDGRLKLHNRAFADLWHLSSETLADHPHIDKIIRACRLLAPQEEPWIDIRGAIAGLADTRLGVNCRMDRQDGSALDCAAQPLPDGATLLTFIDVTASVNVERALTERNEALERASRLRDDFVHHVSYELRSPLTNIIGFAQFLGDASVGPLNPRQRDYTDHIMRSSESLLAILNDILDLASIDTGSLELMPEVVDIRSTIDAAMRGLEDRLAEASLAVHIDAPEDIGSFVADGKRIRQILFNLLSNAVGFSAPGQSIRVSARKGGGEVTIEVRDQGRGIPPEIKAKVFERFESHTLGTRHRGVGLGLAIVRSFVELHGGRIELTSAPGEGTTVVCTFPMERREAPQDGRSGQNAVPPLAAE